MKTLQSILGQHRRESKLIQSHRCVFSKLSFGPCLYIFWMEVRASQKMSGGQANDLRAVGSQDPVLGHIPSSPPICHLLDFGPWRLVVFQGYLKSGAVCLMCCPKAAAALKFFPNASGLLVFGAARSVRGVGGTAGITSSSSQLIWIICCTSIKVFIFCKAPETSVNRFYFGFYLLYIYTYNFSLSTGKSSIYNLWKLAFSGNLFEVPWRCFSA